MNTLPKATKKLKLILLAATLANAQNPSVPSTLQSSTDSSQTTDSQTKHSTYEHLKPHELQKITTTANKYEAEVSSVNSSVQVIKEKQIANANINSTDELGSAFAGLQIQNSDGSSVFPMAVLRGVSSSDYYSTTLNLYVDGVPQSPNFIIQALGDVEQVELLRGAQGTLYGENSQSGLISIRTKNPMKGNYANISLTGSKLYEDLNAYIGGVLIKDKLWGKANLRYTHENGFIKYGREVKKTSDNIIGGVALYYAPTSAFLATLSYNFSFMPNNSKGFYLTKEQFQNNATDFGYEISGDIPPLSSFAGLYIPHIYARNPWHKSLSNSASIKLEYDFGKHILSSISAFSKSDSLLNTYPIVGTSPNTSKGYFATTQNGYFYNVTQALEELRLNSEYKNGIKTTFGAYYKYLQTDNGMRGFIADNGGGLTAFGFRANWNAIESINTAALFLDALFPIGRHFDIGLGARYQYLHSSMNAPVSPGAGITQPYKAYKDWHSFDPRISFGFSISDNAKIYISGTSATKQGGFAKFPYANSDQRPYNPEYIYSAEIGSHLKFLDSRLRANLAVYYMFIKDRQSYVGNAIQQSIKNIGDAQSYGLDADISYYGERVSAGLGLNIGSASYTNSSKNAGYLDFYNAAQSQNQQVPYDVRGKGLKFSPLLSLSANVDWNFLRLGVHRFYLGGNLRFYTKQYFEDLSRSDDLAQKPYAVLDLFARYEIKNVALKIFAQNATNTKYALYSRSFQGMATYYMVGNPWNLGAQIAYKY